jgi:hypothetical protein
MTSCFILQVEACKTEQLYVVNVLSAQGSVLSEVAFNSETGCMGANTVKVGHAITLQTNVKRQLCQLVPIQVSTV